MTQIDKELLLKDLCARLPYKVKVQDTYYKSLEPAPIWLLDLNAQCVRLFADEGYQNIEYIKPYLFPLSSMTEEQKNECFKGTPLEIDKYGDIAVKDNSYGGSQYTDLENYLEVINWLLKNHFDYRGLIPMGLAIDATGLNIY